MGLLGCFGKEAHGVAGPLATGSPGIAGRQNKVAKEKTATELLQFDAARGEPPQVILLVMEAHWELGDGARPYSFGDMLGAFFKQPQYAHVQLRHRRLKRGEDLVDLAAEAAGLVTPTVAVISGHGEAGSILLRPADAMYLSGRLREAGGGEGVKALLSSIDPQYVITRREVGRFLKAAPAVQHLHFGVCRSIRAVGVRGSEPEADQGRYQVSDTAVTLRRDLGLAPSRRVTISGYTTYADWAKSAVAEFHYYALLLDRRLDTYVGRSKGSLAADALLRDIRFSGYDAAATDPGLGFCCFDL